MCVVSMVGDHFTEKWNQPPYQGLFNQLPNVSRQEFEALKKEVEEMKELLRKAKIYDEANGEPNCEMEEKIKTLRTIAQLVGVDIDEIIGKK